MIEGIVQTIRLALVAGALVQARQLATQAATLHPHDTELAKMARILARPVAARRKSENNSSARNNQLWLKQNYENYKDQWVALRDGQLLGIADSIQELKSIIADFTDVMITRV